MLQQLVNMTEEVQRLDLPHPSTPVREVQVMAAKMRGDILGKFKWWTPDTVFINSDLLCAGVSWLVPTVIHELHHHYQLHNQKSLYFTGLVLRPLIERSALELERAVEVRMGQGGLSS